VLVPRMAAVLTRAVGSGESGAARSMWYWYRAGGFESAAAEGGTSRTRRRRCEQMALAAEAMAPRSIEQRRGGTGQNGAVGEQLIGLEESSRGGRSEVAVTGAAGMA
jgi:hypothetical protein